MKETQGDPLMKHLILLKLLRTLQSNPRLRRKVMTLAIAGVAGFVFVGSLAAWASLSLLSYAGGIAQQTLNQERLKAVVSSIQTRTNALSSENCRRAARGLLDVQLWANEPIGRQVKNLKNECSPASARIVTHPKKGERT